MVDLQESLRRSETLSAMGTLVAGVAHEVRNPLFSISANLDAFESRYGKEGEHAGIITLLRSETSRLVSLMNDLLDYGRPGREKPAPQHLEDVATQAVSACASLASHHRVRVLNRISPGLGPVVMDRKRIAQVLQNLLANAVQHSPEGGTVTIEAQEVGARDQAWLECSVSDSGPGFPPEDLPRIFEPFFTRRRGGTGLGLSIVQRIMEMHGGTIVAANRPQGGAIVSLRLPRLGPDGRRSDAAGV
jgi:signal transduction histidine kinase